jgi:phosphatidylglycerol:prolipoprotein diacylglycerol transferase
VVPELFTLEWHGIARAIGSYGVMLSLALWVGSALALTRAKRLGLEQGALISSLGLALAAGFVGAFLCSIGVRWLQLGTLREALAAPGIVFYGALLGGALGLWAGARCFGLPRRVTFDAMVPALPIAHALGRIGCFLGGCCFGAPCDLPWALRYPGESVARHPWPLYEAAALCVLARLFWRPHAFGLRLPGQRALAYVLAYACVRLGLEPLRGDAVRGTFQIAGLIVSSSQIISIVAIAGCALAAAARSRAATLR